MKIITAMIQPFLIGRVTQALEALEGFPGMTVTEARGFGRKMSKEEEREAVVDEFHKKSRLEIVARDEMVEQIVATLVRAAHTGNHGDGKIFVWDVDSATRVQTGETGKAAL